MAPSKTNRIIIVRWHELCGWLAGKKSGQFVSEAAVQQLFTARLIDSNKKNRIPEENICPESFFGDVEHKWRRIDLLIGKNLLFETGAARNNRSRKYQAAVEIKVDSAAV